MAKRYQFVVSVTAVLGLMFLFMACGSGGGGGGDVTYEGSTDPAVADSTTVTALAEYGMGALESGFPLAGPFVTPPPGMVMIGLAAQPLVADFTTTVTIPVPPEAVYNGSDYDSKSGTGTADIDGSMTMLLGNNVAADANTWFIVEVELDGSILFDTFSTGDDPSITGRVTIPYGLFDFSGDANFSMSTMEIIDDPGFPVWQELEMTFTKISVADDGESWSLGEGDWIMSILPGSSVNLDINSLTVKYEGKTYKLEDTRLDVELSEIIPLIILPPTTERTDITITGIDYKAGTFFHHDLGEIQFAGTLREEDPPDDIVQGGLTFYSTMGETLYNIFFAYDKNQGNQAPATFYNLYIGGDYFEKGYYIDGSFIEDNTAPTIIL